MDHCRGPTSKVVGRPWGQTTVWQKKKKKKRKKRKEEDMKWKQEYRQNKMWQIEKRWQKWVNI
jgi:hypothetical protein